MAKLKNPFLDDDEDLIPDQEPDVDPDNLEASLLPSENAEPLPPLESDDAIGPSRGLPAPDSEDDTRDAVGPVSGLPKISPVSVPSQPGAVSSILRPAEDPYQKKLAEADSAYARKNPAWWQRLAAAGAGAAAGYVNIQPHNRPVDASGAISGILYPGQTRKEAQYEREVATTGAAAKAERESQLAQAKIDAEAAHGTAEQQRAAAYADSRKQTAANNALASKRTAWTATYGKRNPIPVEDPNAPVPNGFQLVPAGADPDNPTRAYLVRSAMQTVPAQLAPYLPNSKEGDQVPLEDYRGAVAQLYKTQQEAQKAGDKTPPQPKLTEVTPDVGKKLGVVPNADGKYFIPDSAVGSHIRAAEHAPPAGAGSPSLVPPPASPKEDQQIRAASKANPSLDLDAWSYMLEGKLNVRGRGQQTASEVRLIKARAGQMMNDLGIDPGEVRARGAELKANIGSYAKITHYDTQVRSFEDTLERNAAVAKKLSEQYARGNLQLYNRVLGAWKTGTGDSEALALSAQLHGLANEWGKIMQGSTSAAGVNVSEANASNEFFSKGLSNGQLSALIDNVIVPDARNRAAANQAQKDRLLGEIRGVTHSPGAPVTQQQNTPPPGQLSTGHKLGEVVTVRGGKQIKITSINPDGTFSGDEVKK